jgi:hypothetical protein
VIFDDSKREDAVDVREFVESRGHDYDNTMPVFLFLSFLDFVDRHYFFLYENS